MGMAASQARLLSITSRMSDNELRAQLINNAKMRLTTDSARVSDEYIAALNQTQLMFTNYDTVGNEQYQNLTFNSLTAYSSYNDQYGIVNNAGEILVSATDAANFEKSNNLEDFLGMYGLTKDTTYFEENKLDTVGYYDDYGVWQDLGVTMGDMQAIYEGLTDANGIEHYGYDASLNSAEYATYNELVNEYRLAKDAYKTSIKEEMNKFMDGENQIFVRDAGTRGETFKLTAGGKNFEDLYEELNSAGNSFDVGKYRDYMKQLMAQLGIDITGADTADGKDDLLKYNKDFGDTFVDAIKALYDASNQSLVGSTVTSYEKNPQTYGYAKIDSDGNIVDYIDNSLDLSTIYVSDNEITGAVGGEYVLVGDEMKWVYTTPYPPNTTAVNQIAMDEENYTYEQLYMYESDISDYDAFIDTDDDGISDTYVKYVTESQKENYTGEQPLEQVIISSDPCIIASSILVEQDDVNNSLKQMYEYFKNNAYANLDESIFRDTAGTDAYAKYEAYKEAARNLAIFIYGDTNGNAISEDYYDYLDDPSWVLSQNHMYPSLDFEYSYTDADGNEITYTETSTDVDKTHYNPYTFPTTTTPVTVINIGGNDYPVSYQAIKDVFLIDCMIEHYGEPNYTWIDENNPDENADAKAQWYQNLYERMQEGYKEIPTNLKDSSEWLQFAFESGLVHMEQVNSSNDWISTMYSNCASITESTVDVDVTVAEAKYNKEMNKIEAKDKQYDLELKNIDTEHSSLQTEYDSIKSVIDKNVERNFKMFQA